MAEKCLCGHVRSRHKWGVECGAPVIETQFNTYCRCRDFKLPRRRVNT